MTQAEKTQISFNLVMALNKVILAKRKAGMREVGAIGYSDYFGRVTKPNNPFRVTVFQDEIPNLTAFQIDGLRDLERHWELGYKRAQLWDKVLYCSDYVKSDPNWHLDTLFDDSEMPGFRPPVSISEYLGGNTK